MNKAKSDPWDEITKTAFGFRKNSKNPHITDRVYYYGIYRGLIIARQIVRKHMPKASAKSKKGKKK